MATRSDSFTQLRERTRWRISLPMCLFGMGTLILLGVLNAHDGRTDSVKLSIAVFCVLAACMVMLLTLRRHLGGKIYFWATIAYWCTCPGSVTSKGARSTTGPMCCHPCCFS